MIRKIYSALVKHYRRRQNWKARSRRVVYTWPDERNFSQRKYYVNGGTL